MKNILLYFLAVTLLITISLCAFDIINLKTFMAATLVQVMLIKITDGFESENEKIEISFKNGGKENGINSRKNISRTI
jgi:hypothetical protein